MFFFAFSARGGTVEEVEAMEACGRVGLVLARGEGEGLVEFGREEVELALEAEGLGVSAAAATGGVGELLLLKWRVIFDFFGWVGLESERDGGEMRLAKRGHEAEGESANWEHTLW